MNQQIPKALGIMAQDQPARTNYSISGTVREILRGSSELEEILDSAWCYDNAVLVDYTVPYCGPCRMLSPLLEAFAKQYKGTIAIIKVDCQSTEENRNLASAQGIQGYPTVQIYSDKVLKKQIRGFNQQELIATLATESEIMKARQTKTSKAAFDMAEKLADELEKMKQEEDTADFLSTSRTILTYMRNIALHPEEEKYRKIRVSNKHFHARLGCKTRGIDCMKIIGFKEVTEDDEEKWLIMKTVPQSFIKVAKLLAQAVPPTNFIAGSLPSTMTTSSQVTPQQLASMLQSIMSREATSDRQNEGSG